MSASNTGSKLVSLVAAVPLLVCFRDNMFSLCKVQGSSMEPTLQNGDVLLVRKADFPIVGRMGRRIGVRYNRSDVDESLLTNNDTLEEETKKRRLREYEFQHFAARENAGVWARWPPSPARGQIITYRSPDAYPPDLVIKRVIGLAGQVVEAEDGLKDVAMNSVWVEGDNPAKSSDSRDHGVVNTKLVVGVAEYCVWPPSRIRKLETKADDDRAFWL